MNDLRYRGAGWSPKAIKVFEKIISAHGGWANWDQFDQVKLDFKSFTGVVPWWKGNHRNFHLSDYVIVRPKEYFLSIHYSTHMNTFDNGKVIFGEKREVIEDGNALLSGKTFENWRPEQFTYFAGYALTNYMSYPFNLVDQELLAVTKWSKGYCFKIKFSEQNHNHNRIQSFYFNEEFILEKFYYRAKQVSPFAIGAHYPKNYIEYKGIKLGLRRSVKGRFLNFEYNLKAIEAIFTLIE